MTKVGNRMEIKEIFFGGYKVTYDMDALTEALDKIEPDERMCVYPLVLWDDGSECAITVKLDDGYDEEDDDCVDYYASGHHLLRLTEPDSGESFVLLTLGDYSAKLEPCERPTA